MWLDPMDPVRKVTIAHQEIMELNSPVQREHTLMLSLVQLSQIASNAYLDMNVQLQPLICQQLCVQLDTIVMQEQLQQLPNAQSDINVQPGRK